MGHAVVSLTVFFGNKISSTPFKVRHKRSVNNNICFYVSSFILLVFVEMQKLALCLNYDKFLKPILRLLKYITETSLKPNVILSVHL